MDEPLLRLGIVFVGSVLRGRGVRRVDLGVAELVSENERHLILPDI